MKLNGKSNIITDADITLTNNHIGESLQTVLEDTDKRIDKLESNVKWIYQNGGVGSGTGGGGGGIDRWTLKATLGGIALESNQQLPLSNGAGNYQLRIYTSGGSGAYSVTYSYGGLTKKLVLSADNGWTSITSIPLVENGILEIIATDGSVTREITGVNYIVIPYVFSEPKLYDREGREYSSAGRDIFVETAIEGGIIIKSSYVIAAESRFWYTWYFNGIAQNEPIEILDKTGVLEYEIDNSFFANDNAGLYSYQLTISVLAPTSTEPYEFTQSNSFNLIPDNLYLKISPANNDEVIYDTSNVLDPFVFSTNTSVALNTRIYNGLTASGLTGKITWVVNNDPNYVGNGSLNVQDGLTYTISTYFSNVGWNYITFTYTLGTMVGQPITKWFYCKEVSTSYDWFFKTTGSENTPSTRRYYIPQALVTENKLYGITGVDSTSLYVEKKKSNYNATVLNIVQDVDNKSYTYGDQMFNFGIQYNEINDVKAPIIICYDSQNNEAIKIYQDKVLFGGGFSSSELSCNLFLHKEDQYDASDRTKYHLLTINCATCYYDDSKSYYELTVYFDGKIEGTVNTKPFSSAHISSISLQPANFALNHLEISSWGSITERRVFDIDVNWYYNSYASRIGKVIPDSETLILESLFDTRNIITGPNYDVENDLVKVNVGLPNTVASNTEVPVLVLTCSKDIYYNGENKTIYEWMNSPWRDGQEELNKSTFDVTKLEWAPGGEGSILSEIEQPKDVEGNLLGQFTLDLQGSSTMTYKSKNFTLGIRPTEYVTLQNKQTLFSPNFNSEDESTFLPETSFTLKADVVDSSHSNNTAVGKFVNDNNTWDYRSMINLNNVQQEIRTHIKQCLEGFSTLVFLNVTWKDGSGIDHVNCYYLGIYNFNLGRGSYFNLGYSDLTQLDYHTLDTSANSNHGFAFCVANTTPVRGFVAAEVQENSPYYDFSQYDNSILFPLPNSNETSGFMFGDIVASSNTENVEQSIQQFVKSVAGGGGFLFDLIGKRKVPAKPDNVNPRAYRSYSLELDPVTEKNKVYTYVNDYSTQYIRVKNGTETDFIATQGDLQNLTPAYLEECVVGDIEQNKNPKLDYESVVYYYVTCMVLGLVDSVQKNLNIKTWNASDAYPTMGAFFYDMDTCLGKSNSGAKTSYFAFSDYWKSTIERYDELGQLIPDNDTVTPVARVVNKGITNFRDTFLEGNNVTGYDIPSSYLFAIAKYGYLMDFINNAFPEIFPQSIYAKWRQYTGVLSSADNFINTYFASNLKDIPGCLINLNYRNKYLYDYKEHNSFAATHMLHGTGIEETRDWLKGRLRILDAYFNVVGATTQIHDIYYEPIHSYTVSTNPDVNLYKDIFTNASTTYVSRKPPYMTFSITAPDYSPLVVRQGSNYIWYLFEDANTEYETYVPIDGTQITVFGGSQMWRTLDSINAFVETREATNNDFIFNTNILTSMIGDSGTQTGNWDIYGPSLETINLTGTKYGGTLTINNDFYSIRDVDISNSKISLNIIEDCPVKNIVANNLGGSDKFTLSNCTSVENVSLNRSSIGTCTITPTWTDSLDFSTVYARNLVLEAKNSGTLTISNNASINSLTFSKMQTVNITNCDFLRSVTCVDTEDALLKSLIIKQCPSLTSLTIKADGLEVLNLTGCTDLQEITLRGSNFNNLRILGLANTKVSKITIGQTICENGVFDFTQFPKLAKEDPNYSGTPYVSFYNNKEVVSIQFENSADTILRTDPNNSMPPFRDCSNLERLYGSFLIRSSSCFINDKKFSVHGADLTNVTWNGQSVLASNGRYKHPLEWGVNSSSDYWPRTLGITNMKFDGDYAASAFHGTNYTIFDAYYMLYGCDNRVKSLSNTFRAGNNSTYGRFKWNSSVDNSPNVHMFENCSGVENMTLMFYGNSSNAIRLISPSHTEETVTANNGLFSPLVSLTSWNRVFDGYTVYADRFVLRRTFGNYLIKTLNGLYVKYILDDVNSYTYDQIPSISIEKYGNLLGFFKNLNNVEGSLLGVFDQTTLLDFSTIATVDSKFPDKIVTIGASFKSTYGTGNISLSSYFSNATKLQYIYHSFITDSVLDNSIYPRMELTNNTFERFVPRNDAGDSYPGLIATGYTTDYTGSYRVQSNGLGASFSGVIYKDFGSDFPFDIFKNLPNLTMAAGVFMNAHGNVNNLQLPGNLFERNTLLSNCSAEFYNLDNPYTISETYDITYDCNGNKPVAVISKENGFANFVNCPKLTNVSYMFAGPIGTSSKDSIPSLSGQIPRNLFWHGLNESSTKKNILKGTNTRTAVIDPETGNPTGEYTYGEVMIENQYVIAPNATIEVMNNCFQHCNCDAYQQRDLLYEPNPEYSPFVYLTNDDGETFYINRNRDTRQYTSAWFYDGRTNYSVIKSNEANVVLLDDLDWDATYNNGSAVYTVDTSDWLQISSGQYADTKPQVRETYICAPDLLRYCTEKVDITGLFAYSGCSSLHTYYYTPSSFWNVGGKYAYGILGRICPYLLKPVPKISSVDKMFEACKRLSYVRDNENGSDYLLPANFFIYTTDITSLQEMFMWTVQPPEVNMRDCFVPLKRNNIDIERIFCNCYWQESSSGSTLIDSVFASNNIASLVSAFHIEGTTQSAYPRSQKVTFNNVFNSKYASNTYATNSKFSNAFRGWTEGRVTHEVVKTLPDNTQTNNYTYVANA